MGATGSITEAELRQLADEFYGRLAAHAPVEQFDELLAKEGLVMKHPNADLHGRDGFAQWYGNTIHRFFNETHTVRSVTITRTVSDAECEAEVVEGWQASFWNPPEPRSQRIQADSGHLWGVRRDPDTGKPVLVTYAVTSVQYAPGSARL